MAQIELKKTKLYGKIISDENIFSAIYALKSYIFERNLLNSEDLTLYYQLQDSYNKDLIKKTIEKCKYKLKEIIADEKKIFEVKVYFKAKKYDKETGKIETRPIHTADLITQICIVCLLNILVYKEDSDGKRVLSDVSQLFPSNFYGNMPSTSYEEIFFNWRTKYKEYTDAILNEFNNAKTTDIYETEICLDLKKYFPSLNPNFIYSFILDKISTIYQKEELDVYKILLKKLLYFEIINLKSEAELSEYYEEYFDYKSTSSRPNLGLPQGLPQAYYFGNIGMVLISKAFEKEFEGKSFYYVDDSVIYTHKQYEEDDAKKCIEQLQDNINNIIAKILLKEDIVCIHDIPYRIKIHQTDKKSSFEKLSGSINVGKNFLRPVVNLASQLAHDIYNTFDPLQDISFEQKIDVLQKAIKAELELIKEKNDNTKDEHYKSLLKRYNKFFLYRKKILFGRTSENNKSTESDFYKKYYIDKIDNAEPFDIETLEMIFKNFDEDIFSAEAHIILSVIDTDNGKNNFIDKINKFEKKLLRQITDDNLYFSKSLLLNEYDFNPYGELEKICKNFVPRYSLVNHAKRNFALKSFINYQKLIFENRHEHVSYSLGFGFEYDREVFKFSKEYRRKILNAYISKIYDVHLSDRIEITKYENRPLKYFELRILAYIRNKNFQIDDFFVFTNNILDKSIKYHYEKVDMSIYEVLGFFRQYVKLPQQIDILILSHKYVSSLWKNGARFLYYYTPHDHEHSVELIKCSTHVCKMISQLKIKSIDYFILYLSCYFHDIAMVIQPNFNNFTKDHATSDEIFTEWKIAYENLLNNLIDDNANEKRKTKLLLQEFFVKINSYFENLVRNNHVKDSAFFISKNKDLNFIDDVVRSSIATVSEAHGFDATDVYNLKSNARSEVLSIKYMMILLRLADLLDIAKDRVRLNIMKQNIHNMPEFSKYHWITHSTIDEYKFSTSYEFKNKKIKNNDGFTYLSKENFHEKIIVEIHLNAYNLTKVNPASCQNVCAKLNYETKEIIVELGKNKKCQLGCNFLCKWIFDKNNYLLSELNALLEYFNNLEDNNFESSVEVHLKFEHAEPLDNTFFDIVAKYIN